MDRQTGIGMKDRYLKLIFKIVLLESSDVETNSLMTDGWKIVQTGGNNLLNIGRYLVRYLSNKKIILKIGLLELVLEKGVRTDGRMDRQKYKI